MALSLSPSFNFLWPVNTRDSRGHNLPPQNFFPFDSPFFSFERKNSFERDTFLLHHPYPCSVPGLSLRNRNNNDQIKRERERETAFLSDTLIHNRQSTISDPLFSCCWATVPIEERTDIHRLMSPVFLSFFFLSSQTWRRGKRAWEWMGGNSSNAFF